MRRFLEEANLIKVGSRKRNLTFIKRNFSLKAAGEGYTLKQIEAFINISDAAVHKLIS